MSLKHAILGFLSFQPLSGYDLKKAFDQSVQHFWPANQSQIYRTLAALTDDGLVEQEVIEREERLDMKVYHINDAGHAELHRWLSTPLPRQVFREAFLIQIYFGSQLTDEEFVALVRDEIKVAEEILSVYDAIYKPYLARMESSNDPRALFLKVLTLEFGILHNRLVLDWLNSVVTRINAGNYSLKDFQNEMQEQRVARLEA
jgi:PadR family transcriptional regulator AphA